MKKILVVVDMQNDFIGGVLGTDSTRSAVQGCIDLCKSGDFDNIVFTMDTHQKDYSRKLEGKTIPPHCMEGSDGWAFIPELAKFAQLDRSKIVWKDTFGSLFGTWIDLRCVINEICGASYNVRVDGFVELHFCGVCTSICVLSNIAILRASYPNTKIVLHTKATGDVSEEAKQAAILCARNMLCDIED